MFEPLLLVDVDGVVSLFGFDPGAPPAGRWEMVEGIAHFLSATAGEHLRTLQGSFQLVWCTGWEEKASEYLPQALGLPAIPHLSLKRNPGRRNTHWKLSAIDAFAGQERALAWIDDAHDERTRGWAGTRAGPTLLLDTLPAVGLTDEHVAVLLEWAQVVRGGVGGRTGAGGEASRTYGSKEP